MSRSNPAITSDAPGRARKQSSPRAFNASSLRWKIRTRSIPAADSSADAPLLTDRSGLPRRKPLLRAVLDSKLRLSPQSRIVKTSDDDLLVFTAVAMTSAKARKLQNAGVEVIRTKTKNGRIDLLSVLA